MTIAPEIISKINEFIPKVISVFESSEPVPVLVAINAISHVLTYYCQNYGITSKDQLIADLSKLWDDMEAKNAAAKAASSVTPETAPESEPA